MKTPEKRRIAENARKAARKAVMKPALQLLKQVDYARRTGRWEPDPTKLHWHHLHPDGKYRKVCHLASRSPRTIVRELAKCIALHEKEHWRVHGSRVLRTK